MKAVVANLVADGTKVLVVVNGYFGDRIVQMCERYGATVRRIDVERGKSCEPGAHCDRLSRPGLRTSLRWFMQKRRPARAELRTRVGRCRPAGMMR
jgi:hypothetical protein